jgi:hypothetical protein
MPNPKGMCYFYINSTSRYIGCKIYVYETGCVTPTSYYHTSILHQDILSVRAMYMRPTCMGPIPYVS